MADVYAIGFNSLRKRSGKKLVFTLSALIVFETYLLVAVDLPSALIV